MQVRIIRKNGFRGAGIDLACGAEADLPAGLAVSLIADGMAVPVRQPDVETVAPVIAATHNGSFKRGRKK